MTSQPQPVAARTAACDDDDDWTIDDSDALLAVKMLSEKFPTRAAPKGCPALALHSQLQVRMETDAEQCRCSLKCCLKSHTHFAM